MGLAFLGLMGPKQLETVVVSCHPLGTTQTADWNKLSVFLRPFLQYWERSLFCLIHRNKQRTRQNEEREICSKSKNNIKTTEEDLNDLNDTEIRHLSDKEFKLTVTEMPTELRKMDEHSKNFDQ